MEGIMPIADRVLVLERGRLIADGPPKTIANDRAVVAAYLGEEYRAPGE
jgi:branched-chain amino acid transport system ATP-binding protein